MSMVEKRTGRGNGEGLIVVIEQCWNLLPLTGRVGLMDAVSASSTCISLFL